MTASGGVEAEKEDGCARSATPRNAAWTPQIVVGLLRAYSQKRAVRDSKTLTLQEERAWGVIAGGKAARAPRFVKTSGDGQSLDEAAQARARRLAGLNGYLTNIPARIMPARNAIGTCHRLCHVEQSFRKSKTDLAA